MSTLASPIDRLKELGGSLWLDGDTVCYAVPAGNAEAREVLTDLRHDRDAIAAMLRERESKAPELSEIAASLPPGVRLESYQPKEAPFVVTVCSEVSNAGKFYRAYLTHLRWRLKNPNGRAAPPLAEILSKLADAGLELRIDGPR